MWRAEVVVRSLRSGVSDSCELPGYWDVSFNCPQDQQGLLTSEPSHQPCFFFYAVLWNTNCHKILIYFDAFHLSSNSLNMVLTVIAVWIHFSLKWLVVASTLAKVKTTLFPSGNLCQNHAPPSLSSNSYWTWQSPFKVVCKPFSFSLGILFLFQMLEIPNRIAFEIPTCVWPKAARQVFLGDYKIPLLHCAFTVSLPIPHFDFYPIVWCYAGLIVACEP